MALKDVFKVGRKTFVNPTGWLDYDMVKQNTQTVFGLIKSVFVKPRPEREETFQQAQERLKLTDDQIKEIGKNYQFLAYLFALAGVVIVGTAVYLLSHLNFAGCLLALAVSAVLFAQAFRNHFWYFQIKHRKLGCTFEEWRRGKVE